MLLFFSFSLASSLKFHHIESKKLSKKTAMVSLAGSDRFLAVAEVSDSISRFPPRLNVYAIGSSKMTNSISVNGEDSSLGYSLAPIKNGFIASSPQAAYRWGKPGPIITTITPGKVTDEILDTPLIPYGETMAASFYNKLVVACSPLENKGCIVKNGTQRKLNSPENTVLFGIAVSASPSGRYFATMSRDMSRPVSIHIYNSLLEVESSFKVVHNPQIDLQQMKPYLHFDNDKYIIAGFPEIGKIFIYKRSTAGWVTERPADIEMTSMSKMGMNFVVLTNNGQVKILNNLFNVVSTLDVQRSIRNSNFTKITGGDSWIAILEEDGNERTLHIYSTKSPNYIHALIIVALLLVTSISYIILRPKISLNILHQPVKKLF